MSLSEILPWGKHSPERIAKFKNDPMTILRKVSPATYAFVTFAIGVFVVSVTMDVILLIEGNIESRVVFTRYFVAAGVAIGGFIGITLRMKHIANIEKGGL